LNDIFTWLGLDVDSGFCERAIEACAIEKLRAKTANAPWSLEREPENFYRKGTAESWRDDLSLSDVRVIEYIAGDLMDALGYEASRPRRKPLSLTLTELEGLIAARCSAAGRRWRARIEDRHGVFVS
jgi:hypothetical protein